MSAILRLYKGRFDPKELEEDYIDSNGYLHYTTNIGPISGYDGDKGGTYDTFYYIRNEGDVKASDIVVRLSSNQSYYFKLSIENNIYKDEKLNIPDLEPGAIIPFMVTAIIPRKSDTITDNIVLTFDYYTLPGNYDLNNHFTEFNQYPRPNVNICTHIDYMELHGGKPLGPGVYGEPIYGQEGFIHVTKPLTAYLPIGGMCHTYVNASYTINKHYTDSELTIEDIQSFNTFSYMDLDCFDGPMLPLWLNVREEDIQVE